MNYHKPILASALAVAAMLPAAALAKESEAARIADRLNDPATQYAVAGMISAMSKAVLDIQVGPFLEAMEGMKEGMGKGTGGAPVPDLGPDATVADLTGTRHADVREKVVENVPRMMAAMGTMAGSLEAMMPQLRAMAEQMKAAVPHY